MTHRLVANRLFAAEIGTLKMAHHLVANHLAAEIGTLKTARRLVANRLKQAH